MTQPTLYSVHPSVAYVQAIVDNLEATTGKDLAAWLKVARAAKLADPKALTAHLKKQGLGGTQAGIVSERALARPGTVFDDTPEGYLAAAEGYVAQQFAGKKAALRPLYDALLDLALDLGPGVQVCPCATIVPLYHHHVFAQIKATTQTRLDLGLALGDPAMLKNPTGRLIDTGGFQKKDRLTVRVEVKSLKDLDADLGKWMKWAYEMDGAE